MIPLILIILGSVLIIGTINRTGSIISGRVGVPFLQPLYNVCVLMRKGSVISSRATIVTTLGPVVALAALVVAALVVPFGSFDALISFRGDVVLFCSLLAVSRVAMVLVAMDSGSSFQGMGASRDAFFSMLVEPALLLLLATLCMITGNASLSSIFAQFDNMSINLLVLSVVVGYGFYKLSLVDTGRVPISDPATHLELTMTHEVMVLDLSSIDLAFFNIAGWIRLSIFGLLVANSLIPSQISGWLLFGLYFVAVMVYAIVIGVGESIRARNRMNKNPTYVATISAIGLLAFIVAYMLITNQITI